MHHVHQKDGPNRASDTGSPPVLAVAGRYLTDGETLFHVERTLVENPRGELLLELEDCVTLELIVCSSGSVAELGLRPVWPLTPATS
jgi:hypothetical protein